MMLNQFTKYVINQDDIDAYKKNTANVHGRMLDNPMDIISMMPILSALYRNQVRTKGKLEF